MSRKQPTFQKGKIHETKSPSPHGTELRGSALNIRWRSVWKNNKLLSEALLHEGVNQQSRNQTVIKAALGTAAWKGMLFRGCPTSTQTGACFNSDSARMTSYSSPRG